jgi:hypothetical protein
VPVCYNAGHVGVLSEATATATAGLVMVVGFEEVSRVSRGLETKALKDP